MKKLTDLLNKELTRLAKSVGTRECTKCGQSHYLDEMRKIDGWVCLTCSTGTD